MSRSSTRLAGWITIAAGIAGGLTVGALSVHRTVSCTTSDGADVGPLPGDTHCEPAGHHVDGTLLGAGIGIFLVGAVLGTWMTRRSDVVSFRVVPVVARTSEGSGQRATVEGLTLQATF